MSSPAEPPEDQEDLDKFFAVFGGSSPEDVSHARQLWSSLSLLPPLESRLVSADIRQRLPVSRPQQRSSTAATAAPLGHMKPPSAPALRQREEERQRYAVMADQRREILALLRRQREQRIQKELASVGFKPKKVGMERKIQKIQKPPDCESDEELVRQLQ